MLDTTNSSLVISLCDNVILRVPPGVFDSHEEALMLQKFGIALFCINPSGRHVRVNFN
jgi:hypothetical protein